MKARLPLFLALALATLPALAQTWDGDSGNNWGTATNWTGDVAPVSGPATALTFGAAASFTPNLEIPYFINSMSITSPGYSFSGNVLTFVGTAPTLTVVGGGSSFSNPLSLGSTTLTLSNSGAFALAGGLSGPAGNTLVKTGAGTLTVTHPIWHGGSTIVLAGTLQLGDGLNGPGNVNAITNAGAIVFNTPTTNVNGVITGPGSMTVQPGMDAVIGPSGRLQHQGLATVHGRLIALGAANLIDATGPLVITATGRVDTRTAEVGSLSGSGILFMSSGNRFTAGADDGSSTFTGNFSGGEFRKTGAGTFTIGTTFWNASALGVDAPGTLHIGDGTIGPGIVTNVVADGTIVFDTPTITLSGSLSGSGSIRVEAGHNVQQNTAASLTHQGTTTINGVLQGSSLPRAIDNNGPLIMGPLGIFQAAGATVGSLSGSGRLQLGASTNTFTTGGDNTSTTFSGQITGSSEFRKIGTGTLTMAVSAWTSGDTTVEGGTLRLGNGTTGPGGIGALLVDGAVVFDTPALNIGGAVTGVGSLRVETGAQVFNGASAPLAHQGSTTVNGRLDAGSSPFGSIANNSPLVIGPTGSFTTLTGVVGSLAGSGQFSAVGGTFIAGGDNSSTTFSGSIGGSADFRKIGAGILTIASSGWFGGEVTVEAPGALRVGNGSTGPGSIGALVVDGTLVFSTPSITASGAISGSGNVIIQSGSTVSSTSVLTHAGTTIVSGQLSSGASLAIDNNAPLLLSGAMFAAGATVGSFSGGGTLNLGGGIFTTGGDNTANTFAGTLAGGGVFAKTGNNTLTLSGSSPTYSGTVQVNSGTLHVSGSLNSNGLNVATGATLMGNGTITGPVNVEVGANLAPGSSVGTLTTGNYSQAGTLRIEVNGTAPGTQHDRLNVNGTVALSGPLSLSGGYIPVAGNTFTIINNDASDLVTGTFAGLPEGGTLSFNGATLRISYVGGTGNDVVLSVANFTVTPSAGPNGGISPSTPQAVAPGGTIAFSVTPNAGFAATMGGTCGGSLVGSTYTTNAVNADCTVVATFAQVTFTVTPSSGANGSISPTAPQTVASGGTTSFTVTANAGYTAAVGGTCGGGLVGTTYTTNAVTGNCTVVATFSQVTFTVTPSAGANGTISPNGVQTVGQGATTTFTVTPNAGFSASVGGTCGGSLIGTTYTTNAVTADCTVAASFTAVSYIVTPSAGANGAISPSSPQSVAHGSTTSFSVGPAPGYVASVGGTCGGTLSGTTYLTNPITANCTVSATFTSGDPARLFNISTRGQVLTANDVMIGGFIIGGSASKTVVVRARGPSLVPLGLANALPDPELRLFSGQTVIGYNNNWQDASNAAQVQASGYVPPHPLESALLVTLAPGPYTAIVSGVGGSTGIGMIEVFEVDAAGSPLVNIATRGRVGIANNVLIAGLIIQGTGPQQVVVRARGPSLTPLGVASALADPQLSLSQSSDGTVVGANDNWGTAPNAAALQASGFAPSDPNEAALLVTLHPGAYTVVVTGANNTSGVAIVEVFAAP